MGMADHQLLTDPVHDISKSEAAFFLFDAGMEHHLEQHVTELFLQPFGIPLPDRLERLMGLLEKIGGDAFMGLLPIPGQPPGERSRSMIASRSSSVYRSFV